VKVAAPVVVILLAGPCGDADFNVQLVIQTDNGNYTVDLPAHRMTLA
jgi:hypothetical protein